MRVSLIAYAVIIGKIVVLLVYYNLILRVMKRFPFTEIHLFWLVPCPND